MPIPSPELEVNAFTAGRWICSLFFAKDVLDPAIELMEVREVDVDVKELREAKELRDAKELREV